MRLLVETSSAGATGWRSSPTPAPSGRPGASTPRRRRGVHRSSPRSSGCRRAAAPHGGEGIQLAYEVAQRHFIEGRPQPRDPRHRRRLQRRRHRPLAGAHDPREAPRAASSSPSSASAWAICKDSTLEQLADQGNGNYAYIDTELEARKVLVAEAGGTLITDRQGRQDPGRVQPRQVVHAYRLIGYENRLLADQDFKRRPQGRGRHRRRPHRHRALRDRARGRRSQRPRHRAAALPAAGRAGLGGRAQRMSCCSSSCATSCPTKTPAS